VIFLNGAVLVGLAAIAIPILIHLIQRRRAPAMDWGAMRFLRASLAARQRRTLLEELLLMTLRCLLVALLVTAAARPFAPSTSGTPWALVLPGMLTAAVCAAVGAVMRANRLLRWLLFGAAAALIALCMAATAAERLSQEGRWSHAAPGQDVAILVDGSLSMTVTTEGRTNFQRALDEARALVRACRPGDTVSIILAGPAPEEPVLSPTSDHELALSALDTLAPTGGAMEVLAAMDVAASALAHGHSPAKKIILITDGQDVGWDARSEGRWQFLESSLRQLPTAPQVVCRMLPLPAEYINAAACDLTFSRAVVGTDRPVRIDVKVWNSGTAPVGPLPVELQVDGSESGRTQVSAIQPGAAETVRFEYRFETPGPHVVSARLVGRDDLPGDDVAVRVLDVADRLPVLLIDGAPSARPLESAASLVELAMAPAADRAGQLIEPTVVPITDVAAVTDFSPYRLVVLANVPQLPSAAAGALALFVRRGGGLLIALGDRTDRAFYNEWRTPDGLPLVPATLTELRRVPRDPARISIETFSHPALALVAGPQHSDVASARVDAYWRIEAGAPDASVRVGARLDSGDPFLVERKVGRGFVLMTTASLGRRDSNLPALKCFVPLVHELAYYLAAPTAPNANVKPGEPVTCYLPSAFPAPAGQVEVLTPSNVRRPAQVSTEGNSRFVRYAATGEPGLYRVTAAPETAPSPEGVTGAGEVPFVVLREPEESRLSPLADEDLERAHKYVAIFRARTTDEMTAAFLGEIPGQELWKQLAACALLVALAEIAAAAWITVRRGSHSAESVRFSVEAADPERLRDSLRQRTSPSAESAQR